MNKYLKGCLIASAVLILIIGLIAGWFWWSMETSHKSAGEDGIKYSKEFDSITTITEKPAIMLGQFRKDEIDQLKFYLIRNNEVITDTTVHYTITEPDKYLNTNIPFENFKKSDSIIVETKNKIYFTISGFHHYAYLHYSMFGYVGNHDCRFADGNYTVNGKNQNGTLLKKEGKSKIPLSLLNKN
ncbi:hypothetical protein OMO38_10010 [Chryseobacterium sp. 09-1422]|uniref:Lipoprotein n=1 Tax=Chryseobacterium kimseyorum TaxID=2984028 RepID=A0ABT3HYI5_9FLAO|nr:hypothetical protein [Chryseobacterium kimseyorum]MCW3168854.1 hypothetical protein [Chryseobacterium kimseyorum]